MSTYEEFMIILTMGLLIVAILNLKNKKQPSYPEKVNGYSYSLIIFAGTGEYQSPSGYPVKHIIRNL